jgi:HTH-type transcriptional regulator/antitoxin HigA
MPDHRSPTSELDVDYASPPGALLDTVLKTQGLSQADLADRTGLSTKYINQLIKRHVTLSADTAVRLEAVTSVPAEMWTRLEADYRAGEARAERDAAADHWTAWLENFRLPELKKRGIIPAGADPTETVVALLRFFGISDPGAWDKVWKPSLTRFRQSASFRPEIAPTTVWLRMGQRKANAISTAPYDANRLTELIPTLRTLTKSAPVDALPALRLECAKAGVAVVYASEITGCRASGATWWARPDKAVVLLSDRGKREDRFWFSFFHECGHLLKHAKRDTYLDQSGPDSDEPPWEDAAPTSGFIDDDSRDSAIEREADDFATSTLIPDNARTRLLAASSEADIKSIADDLDIGPGVVAGRWQFETKNYTKFNALRRQLPADLFADLA